MIEDDSIVDRAGRVHHGLEGVHDPSTAQVAVGGPCPDCGERVEIVMRADTRTFDCGACGGRFSVPAA